MARTPIIPSGMEAMYRHYHFAPALKAGGFLFVSGQLGLKPDMTVADGISEQIDCAFAAIGMILGAAGADFSSIVEISSFHVGPLVIHMPAFINALARVVGEPFPAWTAVEVSGLALPDAVVEIKATALAA
jgi:enamine deaminase RidA (YjgF/YER057c/UK114 family)